MPDGRQYILIVDSDRLLGEFYSCLFEHHGYVPVCAGSTNEALEILGHNHTRFSCAVVDLLPPTEQYWRLIRHLKNSPSTAELPIVTITGMALSLDELEQIRDCCQAVLLKGCFELSKLRETVAQAAPLPEPGLIGI